MKTRHQLLVILGCFRVQNAYVSTGGSCEQFHEENSMLYIQNPSPGDHNNLDGFFLHRVSPLEMVSLWLYILTLAPLLPNISLKHISCNFFL
jgi:hypothetical protein